MSDYDAIQRENAQVLHLLLTPFRWAIDLVKFAGLVLLFILVFTYNQLGWIVGLGHMGYLSRKATADIMVGIPHPLSSSIPPDKGNVYMVDFSARQETDRPDSVSLDKVARVAIDPIPDSVGAVHPPNYCSDQVASEDPGQAIEGWFNRTRSVYERKGSRMFEAYVTGAISVSYLRTALTRIKMGMPPEGPTTPGTDCEMDPQDALALSPESFARWQRTSASIRIPAPSVRMRIISTNGIHDAGMWSNYSGLIIGMCLNKECGDGLEPYVTMYADLLASKVPLSERQERAVDALNGLASFDYWLDVARRNGITGQDARLHYAYQCAMYRIKNATNPDRVPGSQEWTDFLGFEA